MMKKLVNPSGKRKTIAVLSAQLSRVWGSEFMSGVLDSARAADVNVVCFVGGKPTAIGMPKNEGHSYGLYDLIRRGSLMGFFFRQMWHMG
ncbi:MAG: hypothetical protein IPJ47_18895 [Anaerolineales bacterium]|nr:hypothetical protein [Anaerolineales bacterium]